MGASSQATLTTLLLASDSSDTQGADCMLEGCGLASPSSVHASLDDAEMIVCTLDNASEECSPDDVANVGEVISTTRARPYNQPLMPQVQVLVGKALSNMRRLPIAVAKAICHHSGLIGVTQNFADHAVSA